MKQDPHDRQVSARMAPGALSREGFLGHDRRGLAEIIDTDNSTVVGLGVTHGRLAGRLGKVLSAAVEALGRPVQVGGGWTATFHEAMGRLPCPWPGCGTFPKGHVELTHAPTGRGVRFTPLSVHLIAAHGFYQGRGSVFRLDPAELSRLLPDEPGR